MPLGKGLSSLIPPRDEQDKKEESVQQTESQYLPVEDNIVEAQPTTPTTYQPQTKPIRPPQSKSEAIFQIEVDRITPNPYQPRRQENEEELRELAKSIREVGIIQPILVSKIEQETETGTSVEYQLIAGERRLRAAKLIGMERIPAIIRKIENKRDKLAIALIENIQRANLNPLDTAKSYARLQDEFSLTQREIASKVGKSRESVANTLRILNLPSHMQEAVAEGKLSESQARALLSKKNPVEQEDLFSRFLKKKVTQRRMQSTTLKEASRESNFWERQLEEKLSAPVQVTKQGDKGKVVIKFFSEEGWKALMDKLLED